MKPYAVILCFALLAFAALALHLLRDFAGPLALAACLLVLCLLLAPRLRR
jgi:hypothetical protein